MYDDKTPWWRHPIWRPLTIWRNLTRDLMNPRLEETLKNHLSPLGKGLFCFHSPLAPLDPPSVPPLPTCRPNKPVELTAGVKGGGRGERGELPLLASWRLQSFFCNQSSPTRRWHPTRRQWWSDNIRQNRLFPTKTSNFRLYFRTSNFLSNTHTHFDANVFSLVFWHPPLNCWNGHWKVESLKSLFSAVDNTLLNDEICRPGTGARCSVMTFDEFCLKNSVQHLMIELCADDNTNFGGNCFGGFET